MDYSEFDREVENESTQDHHVFSRMSVRSSVRGRREGKGERTNWMKGGNQEANAKVSERSPLKSDPSERL